MLKYCTEQINSDTGEKGLWLNIFQDSTDPDSLYPVKAVTWRPGNCNLVITIPHAGTIGSDTTGAGQIYCESGNIIKTRIGTAEHPIKTYTRDAATDVIGTQISDRLSESGLKPHIVECHFHRSKVECNRSVEEIAVDKRGEEAEEILNTFHSWTSQAIDACKSVSTFVPGVLLVDLHGHGHQHEFIEMGYRLTADLLNAIADPQVDTQNWNNIMKSSARNQFTLRHLVRRKFGLDRVEEAVIGETSFATCIHNHLDKFDDLSALKCIPSQEKPCPGKLGYFIGANTVREHSKKPGVDCVQIELPLSVRTGDQKLRDHISQVLSDGLLDFYNHHYRILEGETVQYLIEDVDFEDQISTPLPPPAPPRPPPPPPPPPAIVGGGYKTGDGVSHMAAMAKSKMQEELITKANGRHIDMEKLEMLEKKEDDRPGVLENGEISRATVTKKVTKIEKKLKNEDGEDITAEGEQDEANNNGDEVDTSFQHNGTGGADSLLRSGATTPAYTRPKNYDVLINNKSLSAKERKRRQFLFGAETPTPANNAADESATDATDSAKSPEKNGNGEGDRLMADSEPPKADTTMPASPEKKKAGKCCCVIS